MTGANGESAELVYTEFEHDRSLVLGPYTNDTHYLIEAAIPWSMIDPQFHGQSFLVHWSMAFANDFVEVDPPGAQVPAPAPALLMLAGLALPLRRRHAERGASCIVHGCGSAQPTLSLARISKRFK